MGSQLDHPNIVKLYEVYVNEEELSPESAVCGTATYLSPEVIKRTSSTRAQDTKDESGDERELLKQIARGKYKFHNNFWDSVSLEAKDFVRGLMSPTPGRRLPAEQASQHPWIKHHTRHFFGESLLQSLVTGLLVFMVAVAFFYLYFYILSHYFNIENFLVSKLTDASSRAIHSLGVHLSEATDSVIGQLNTLRQSLTQTSLPS